MGIWTHLPSSDMRNDGWALVGTAVTALYQALNNDDDTKYIKSPANKAGASVQFPIDITNVPDGAVITSVKIKLRCSTGTGTPPTGVAPSITINLGSLDDTSRYTTRTIYPTATITTYEVATFPRDSLGFAWDIFRLNSIFCRVFSYIAILDLIRCHKFYCDIQYRVRPTIVVNAPTGTVLTPSPTISWTYTQTDGDPQALVEYKVYTANQAAAVSFNPDTSAPVFAAKLNGDISSVVLPTSLNPDNYVVYVRSSSTFGARSLWVSRQFAVSGPAPGTPGVTDPNLGPGNAVISVVTDAQFGAASLSLRDTSNMLSAQEGDAENSIDGTQYTLTNATLARDTTTTFPGGTSSWKITAAGAGTMSLFSDWVEVVGGVNLTARAQFKTAVTARSCGVRVLFYDSTFTSVGGTLTGTTITDATGTWTEATVTGAIPATAVYAKAAFDVVSAASSEVHNLDRLGLMYGDSTPWSDGGHMSRNLLSSWYSSPGGTAQAGEAWTAGPGTTVTTAAPIGTGGSGATCNKMTYAGLSPSIAFRAAGTVFNSATSGADFTLNKPAGTATGDLMLAFLTASEYATINPPAGWTLVNSAKVDDASTDTSLFILKRTAGSSEPATWTDGTLSMNAGRRTAVVVGYSGAADASTQFVAEGQNSTGNGTPLFLTTPQVNNTDPNAWRVSAFAVSDDAASGTMIANRQAPAIVPSIVYVGSGTPWGSNTTGSFTINKPSGVVSGDLMIASLGTVSSATVTAPAGWTIKYQGSYTSNGGPSLLAVMYRVAGASEPSSWTGSYTGGSSYGRNVVQSVAYRNVNTTTPWIDGAGNSLSASSSIVSNSVTNTNSMAWRVSIFAGLTTGASAWTSSEVTERVDNYYTYSSGTESVAVYDSNGAVGTGAYTRTGYSSQSLYAANSFVGLLNPLSSPPSGVANETNRATASAGAANPWMVTGVFDSAGVAATGLVSMTGIWTPGSGSDLNSAAGWLGIIKPAAPVVAGYTAATMATYVDISQIDIAQIPDTEHVTVTAAFIGSTAGTPYLTCNFYRANVLLDSLVATGSSFGTGTWVKSSATFEVPAGTTRVTMGVSVSDRAISDIVYWDRSSIAFGSDITFRSSTSRATHPVWARPQIQFADDDGTGYGDWTDLPGQLSNPPAYDALSGLAYYVDHTPVPLTNRKYRARTVSLGLAGDQFVSAYGPDSSEFSFTAVNWWLKDISDSDNNIQLNVKWDAVNVGKTNTATTFQPIGEDYPVVLTEGYKGDTFTLDLTPVRHTDWVQLVQMLESGRTLFLQSDIDHAWWVRPIGDLGSTILPTQDRKSIPIREMKVSFVQVAPEL